MKLSELKGLGNKSETMLASIGIHTVEEFLASDPFIMYQKLTQTTPQISLNALYAMIGAQEDKHWQVIAKTRKTEILIRLDDMGIAPK